MHWVDVLNQALGWQQEGRVPADVGLLRRLFASRYLRLPLAEDDETRLRQWLAAVTLGLEGGTAGVGKLLARRRQEPLPEPYESLLSTALVLLLAEDGSGAVVHRCHGVVRGAQAATGASRALEARFADRARLGAIVDGVEQHQCPFLVRRHRGGRFCSKACSNASFAARKARSEPRYFAAKQERYRARSQRGAAARVDRGAFVYID